MSDFHPFPTLPAEIRIAIWTLAVTANSRIIELRTLPILLQNRIPLFSVCSPSVPSLLHINRESRAIALKSYQLIEISSPVTKMNIRHIPRSDSCRKSQGGSQNFIISRSLRAYEFYSGYYVSDPNPVPRLSTLRSHETVRSYASQRVYVGFNQDTIYLGPRFDPADWSFLVRSGRFQQFSKLSNLALDASLWLQVQALMCNQLQTLIYSLRGRPIKQLSIFFDGLIIGISSRPTGFQILDPADVQPFHERGNAGLLDYATAEVQMFLQRIWTYRVTETITMSAPPKLVVKCIRREGNMAMDELQCIPNQVMQNLENLKLWIIPRHLRTWFPPWVPPT
ncbi:hypothetical protein B0J14DRAFT_569065 [Halenospora varia]|nr:hypothetical protein B0J14DRAFT_569065 [Halenospora varia]